MSRSAVAAPSAGPAVSSTVVEPAAEPDGLALAPFEAEVVGDRLIARDALDDAGNLHRAHRICGGGQRGKPHETAGRRAASLMCLVPGAMGPS